MAGERVDFLICDEAQFYDADQVDQLARLVDEMGVDVFAFGITADFRTRLFPGSQRLIELADRVQVLQVEALCWCGARATHNARTVDGVMVVEGEQVVVGDTNVGASEVGYEVLCRRHHMRRMTRARPRGRRAVAGRPAARPRHLPGAAAAGAGSARWASRGRRRLGRPVRRLADGLVGRAERAVRRGRRRTGRRAARWTSPAGEGRTAIWLASLGWQVRAVDFSAVGIDKGRELAAAQGLSVDWVVDDVDSADLGTGFDLVALLYLHLRARPAGRCGGRCVRGPGPGRAARGHRARPGQHRARRRRTAGPSVLPTAACCGEWARGGHGRAGRAGAAPDRCGHGDRRPDGGPG